MILEGNDQRILIDCGGDVRRSLAALGLKPADIDGVYVSHLHNDHIGGLEWYAISTFFNPAYDRKPDLYTHEGIVKMLWESLRGGLRTLDWTSTELDTYFETHALPDKGSFDYCGAKMEMVKVHHMVDNGVEIPCHGIAWNTPSGERIFITTDTRFTPDLLKEEFEKADLIFHDCDTTKTKVAGIHAHYSDLATLPAEIKKKMWLYHYQDGDLPDAVKEGFKGFVTQGQSFEWSA